ncbi:LacI family DNA-binding transcriptional regulator, partial [Staphylococcus saprophyticus]|uniref:LacI family DNA-binding transcriptional regulator n=2 Tax=Staphylococcus TaxID=1279 RepID=UPI0028A56DF3
MVTIKDIANAANVSPSTVSRVISGNSRISVATQEKVKKIMADFNYQPNHVARTLIT